MATNNPRGDRNMNFHITQGNTYEELIDPFTRLYNDTSNTVKDIMTELNITTNQYRRLRKYCIEENLVNRRKKPYTKKQTYKTHPKYYSKSRNNGKEYYFVIKTVDGERVYYGCFPTASMAECMVEKLKACDWDKNRVGELKQEVYKEFDYTPVRRHFVI